MIDDRIPPQCLEMEQGTLGAMIYDPPSVDKVREIVSASDFYRLEHGFIFDAIMKLTDDGEPVDFMTVQNELISKGMLERIGGAPYLITLTQAISGPAIVEYYAKEVADASYRRRLISLSQTLNGLAHDEESSAEEVEQMAQRACFAVDRVRSNKAVGVKELLNSAWDAIEQRTDDPSKVRGMKTGFRDLDWMLGGIRPGELIILGARPSCGKSALALNIASHVGLVQGPVLFFSLEMSAEALALRLLACESRIDGRRLRVGNMELPEWKNAGYAMAKLQEMDMVIDDTPCIALSTLQSRSRSLVRQKPLQLIVVDYLQLVQSGMKNGGDRRTQEIGLIVRGLKSLARECDCAVLAMAQLNRSTVDRKEPLISDLRESGEIEATADQVWLLHPKQTEEDLIGADLIIGKNRDGATGVVHFVFHKAWTRFDGRAKENAT